MDIDVVTVGETMVSFQPSPEGPLAYSAGVTWSVAGAESNVAIGLTRMGKRARWISRLGADPFGDIIARMLAGEGVDTALVIRDPAAPTGVFFREYRGYGEPHFYYYRRGSAASRLAPADFRDEWLEGARHLHVTGITPALSASASELVLLLMHKARDRGMTISFDPNLRRKLWDEQTARATLLEMIPLCDVFLPGMEEADFLVGEKPLEECGPSFLRMGPQVVALKMGAEGSAGWVQGHTARAAAFAVPPPVDCTGAGDAFAAGFLSVFLDQCDRSRPDTPRDLLQPALERGNMLGALVTRHRRDWEGLPTLQELEQIRAGVRRAQR